MKVTVYSTRDCQACKLTKRALDKYGVPYTAVDEPGEPDLERFRGMGIVSFPVVRLETFEFIEYWYGYRHERLKQLADLTTNGDYK